MFKCINGLKIINLQKLNEGIKNKFPFIYRIEIFWDEFRYREYKPYNVVKIYNGYVQLIELNHIPLKIIYNEKTVIFLNECKYKNNKELLTFIVNQLQNYHWLFSDKELCNIYIKYKDIDTLEWLYTNYIKLIIDMQDNYKKFTHTPIEYKEAMDDFMVHIDQNLSE